MDSNLLVVRSATLAIPVQLFVTCLVDLLHPGIGDSVVSALRAAGFEPEVPDDQTCCGQPLFNNGLRDDAAAVARVNSAALSGKHPIVVPSGSCAWTMRKVWPELAPETRPVADRVVEISELLGPASLPALALAEPTTVAWQSSCRALRGLDIDTAPRALLSRIGGAHVVEPEPAAECCGFGGAFAVRYPELSTTMATERLDAAKRAGATTVVTAEPGCLMHLSCTSAARGDGMRVCHLAEIVAEALPKPS